MRTGSDPVPDTATATGTRVGARVVRRRLAFAAGPLVDALIHVLSFSVSGGEAGAVRSFQQTIVGPVHGPVCLTAAPLIRIKNVRSVSSAIVIFNAHFDLSKGKQCCHGVNSVTHDSV